MTGHNSSAMQSAHIRVAKEIGAESLVERCCAENGTEYKKAVHDLLALKKAFTVTVIDDGTRQNVPDLAFDEGVWQTMVAGIVITVVGVTTGIGIGGGSIEGRRDDSGSSRGDGHGVHRRCVSVKGAPNQFYTQPWFILIASMRK
jgi:hypothetical protein